jgi:two-component system phosphate regulon sensor histidine kinase PhoR
MIGNDTIDVYQSKEFSNRQSTMRSGRTSASEISRSKILVNWFRMEDNNYRFFFEYFIDFSDKQKLILKETSVSLLMSIFSIMVVVILFMITYRNLMEEKRLSNLKTDFINNMTHELKTPLSTITVAGKTLEMVQIRTNEEKILETAKLIGKQSIHLNQLINMILEISMWERTQFQLDKKTIEIEEFMHDIVESFKSGGGNGASINQKYNLSGEKIDIDVVYFTAMINNLLSNAVKYSDKEPVIDIEGFTSDNSLCIKVADNGIGINRSDQKHIFDKFYRASTGNIHKFKGLGLGLYYVKRIAEAHGGDVSVSSKPAKGSTFTITIPYKLK